jgi:hypothetical protein
VFLQTPDDGKSPETQKFLVLFTIVTTRQKLNVTALIKHTKEEVGHLDSMGKLINA